MINLFNRNFDAETEVVVAQVGADALADANQTPTGPSSYSPEEVEAMLARTRAAAFNDGKATGIAETRTQEQATREVRELNALDSIQSQLVELTRQDEARRHEIEVEMINLILGIGERIVPDVMATYAIDQLSARIHAGLRMAAGNDRVAIRVSPSVKDSVAERILDFEDSITGRLQVEILADSAITDSAVRLEWRNGFMEYDLGRACEEVLDALRNPIK